MVYQVQHARSNQTYALKTMPICPEAVREVAVMKHLGWHPNLVQLHEVYHRPQQCSLLMEYCDAGDLLSHIRRYDRFSEAASRRLVQQLLEAVLHMHTHRVIHRDLKPENILLHQMDDTYVLKVADLGLSIRDDKPCHVARGTPVYYSPEMVCHTAYGAPSDMWNVGVITFIMICGYHPFDPYALDDIPSIQDRIRNNSWSFDDECCTAAAKDFIHRLLRTHPQERMTAAEALEHAWLKPPTL